MSVQHKNNTSKEEHPIVGRAAEVGYLEQCLDVALSGERQIVFVTGEPGIGKTTVVENFLERIGKKSDLRWSRGQCIEQYGPGEAYLPLLDVGTRLCQGSDGEQAIALLRQYAPTWLVQLPGVMTETEWEQLQRRVQGSTRERMLREAAEVMVRFTQEQGYVLVLEDLHWSDASTLEWLSYMAQRREPAKLLLIGTYRPQDVLISSHPLRGVVQELTARGRCEELSLQPLTETAVEEYLSVRFAVGGEARSVMPQLTRVIHRRTGGNPLFMVNVTTYLTEQHVLRQEEGQWIVDGEITVAAESVPHSLQQLIERQLERLPDNAQRLLEVASVAGMEFSAAEVAAGLQVEVETIEEQCDKLVKKGQFLRTLGTDEWPDGTLGERYVFLHALYHDVLYQRLAETRRVRLHRRIGERKEQAYDKQVGDIAAELAAHFATGRDYVKAVEHHRRAGENAIRRSAHREAIDHLAHGLQLLTMLPDAPERDQRELALQMNLGVSLSAMKGYAAPEVEQAYSRALTLIQRLSDASQPLPALWGLWMFYYARGELNRAYELGDQLLSLAQRQQDATVRPEAYYALGETCWSMGEILTARGHLEQCLTVYTVEQHHDHAIVYGQDPAVAALATLGITLWLLGDVDQAVQRSQEAITLARRVAHPFSEAYALCYAAILHQLRGDREAMDERTAAAITLATEHGFAYWQAQAIILRGWFLIDHDRAAEGLAQIQQGLAALSATGANIGRPHWLMGLAEAQKKLNQREEAHVTLASALAVANSTEERITEAELYRVQGELTLQSPVREQKSKEAEAEAYFCKTLDLARSQQAKSVELRAALSLARLWQRQGKTAEARELLEDIYHWFTEGFDTKDLQEAAELLCVLGGSAKRSEDTRRKTASETQKAGPAVSSSKFQVSGSSLAPSPQSSISAPRHFTLDTQHSALFRREGDYWTLAFEGKMRRVRHTLGMQYLAQLLRHPRRGFSVLALAAGDMESASAMATANEAQDNPIQIQQGLNDAGDVLDTQAKATYQRRLHELQEELAEAQAFNDVGRVEKIQTELDFLTREITRAVGLGGRARKAASPAERARVNVTLAIKTALKRIAAHHPALNQYLTRTIKTGYSCMYTPEAHPPVEWRF